MTPLVFGIELLPITSLPSLATPHEVCEKTDRTAGVVLRVSHGLPPWDAGRASMGWNTHVAGTCERAF